MNCKFKSTNTIFNNKTVYKCEYCGITLALDDPKTEMLCFKQMIDAKNLLREQHGAEPISIDSISPSNLSDFIYDKIQQNHASQQTDLDMCTNEQIDNRLSICNKCEHYQNNVCELCGCQIFRENNYMNKLAHKSASCPIDKWLPIID